jgi:hypothetical protein
VKFKKIPAPQRAGTASIGVRRLRRLLVTLRDTDPTGYRALMHVARSLVEKKSTYRLTGIRE